MGYLFNTAVGRCAVAWTDAGICELRFPEATDEATMRGLSPTEDVPDVIAAVVAGVVGLLSGGDDDLCWVELDLDRVPEFNRAVYAEARKIPPGTTISYGELARRIGSPGGAQAVGKALGDNPIPVVVPCHRILAADGTMHGFSAPGGVRTKQRILEIEGALAPALFELP